MELSEIEVLYENASPGTLALTAGNTGSIEVEGDEEAFAEYESPHGSRVRRRPPQRVPRAR
jgi:hypothetical protein